TPPPPSSTLFPYTTLFRSHLGTTTSLALLASGTDGLFFNSREVSTSSARPALSLTFSPTPPADTTPPDPPSELDASVTGNQVDRSEEHTSELQSRFDLVCR